MAQVNYFISFLADRFYPLNERYAQQFERRFGGTFRPIYILSAEPNMQTKPRDYFIVNEHHRPGTVYLQDYEDQNQEFSSSRKMQQLLRRLVKKQGRVFVVPFTASHLTIDEPGVTVIAPRADLATRFDQKIEHMKLFHQLKVKTPSFVAFKNANDLLKHADHLPACYLSASYTSGGAEAGIVKNKEEIDHFIQSLRPINQKAQILATHFISDVIQAPNVNAIVLGKDRVAVVAIADQHMHGNAYLGNIYPAKITKAQERMIVRDAKRVGIFLSHKGYRGLFGIDFLMDAKGRLYATDLNPRRQGGYFCNVMMSSKIDLIDLEMRVALGEPIPNVRMKDFQPGYAWAHSKLKPHGEERKIKKIVTQGKPEDPFLHVGRTFSTVFYSPNDVIASGSAGYYVTSAPDRATVERRVHEVPERLLKKIF